MHPSQSNAKTISLSMCVSGRIANFWLCPRELGTQKSRSVRLFVGFRVRVWGGVEGVNEQPNNSCTHCVRVMVCRWVCGWVKDSTNGFICFSSSQSSGSLRGGGGLDPPKSKFDTAIWKSEFFYPGSQIFTVFDAGVRELWLRLSLFFTWNCDVRRSAYFDQADAN